MTRVWNREILYLANLAMLFMGAKQKYQYTSHACQFTWGYLSVFDKSGVCSIHISAPARFLLVLTY